MSITERSTRGTGWSAGQGQGPLERLSDGVERVGPRIALVLDVALQDRDGRSLALVGHLDGAGRGRRVPEDRAVGEEPADLELRVDALLETAEQLQHEAVLERDRGVALVPPADLGLERACPAEADEPLGAGPGDPAALAARDAPTLDHLKQGAGERRIPEPVDDQPHAVGRLDPRHHVFRADVVTLPPAGERESVGRRLPFRERHVDEGDHAPCTVAVTTGDADRVGDRHGGHPPALRPEPALPDQVAGEGSLEGASLRRIEHGVP